MKRQEHKGINAKIMQIMSLALEISPADSSRDSGKPHVFVEYYPHCNQLTLRVHCNGWKNAEEPDYKDTFYGEHENACEKADEMIAYLENLKSSRIESDENTMENKLDLHFVAGSDGKGSLKVATGRINGREIQGLTLLLLDNMANAFTENPLEKLGFLKSIHDGIEELILATMLD
ncbi:MAG: hypothetical protein NC489_13320 [Ruminococcus flavefaciens]|nr:hypothetical protein [Ruminococcus flavefaciens]